MELHTSVYIASIRKLPSQRTNNSNTTNRYTNNCNELDWFRMDTNKQRHSHSDLDMERNRMDVRTYNSDDSSCLDGINKSKL